MISLHSPELSAFPDEEEVLLQDGVEFHVASCDDVIETCTIFGTAYTKKVVNVVLVMKSDKYTSMNCFARTMKLLLD